MDERTGEIRVGRRKVLQYGGAALSTLLAGGVQQLCGPRYCAAGLENHDLAAVEEQIEEIYGEEQAVELDPDTPDILIDVVYVEGVEPFQESYPDWLEEYFREEMGINVHWLERRVSADTYESYGNDFDELMVDEDCFYDEVLATDIDSLMHHLIYIPDAAVHDDGEPVIGHNNGTRSVAGNLHKDLFRFEVGVHEIGHSLGLEHAEEESAGDGRIMNPGFTAAESPDILYFTPQEQQEILD